ncbi:hypothetical protein [Lysobacter sp. M2-1]|uniref:hypothetical protein n=1 Tax=Lysobacter sp. M2-1 TaxID=2916839 RepID=UPI001F56CD2C|nr:hypothetical protein [Lysobacter sp. M2-1]
MGKFSAFIAATLATATPLCLGAAPGQTTAFEPTSPTPVVGTVIEFKQNDSIVHFDRGSATFDAVVVQLRLPREAKGAVVPVLYQGEPMAAGQIIKVGDTVEFTMPPSDGRGYPWGIYLSQLSDFRVLSDGT